VFVHEDFPKLSYDIVLRNPLDQSLAFPLCSLPFPFPEYYLDEPIDNPMTRYYGFEL